MRKKIFNYSMNWSFYITITIILFLIIISIYFTIQKNKSFQYQSFTLGTFKRITGDFNQPQLFQNIKTPEGIKIVYYNNNQVVDIGFTKKNQNTHNHSSSIMNKYVNRSNMTVEVTAGFAKEKFARINLSYTATHIYFKVKNKVYYQNIYYFSNGDISFAVYQKD